MFCHGSLKGDDVKTSPRKKTVWIVQQGVWDMPKESMPLAAGYLKATAMADDAVSGEMDIRIFNFGGGDSVSTMAEAMFSQGKPDVVAFSVLGWNYHTFGALAETAKQVAAQCWVVFGGTHVANQAERVFRQHPDVDVVVNTEGEFVFRDLLLAHLAGTAVTELTDIGGISYRDEGGKVMTTVAPPRIDDLDLIPSPFLTGAIPLTDDKGEFRYDVALIETNRGCPYKCGFCFWGGAVGQKVRCFSRERLRAELEIFAHHKVHTIVLCDANIGMLRQDLEFVEDLIETRRKYGFPRAVEGSWAKNKSKVFYEIVRRMKEEGMKSSFTLALQTLDSTTLEQMRRKNMKVNEWEDLVGWLRDEGLDCYAELIWGAPGETPKSFFEGYDRLARHMTRIAVYPLLLLPNTEYTESKSEFGFTTVRGENDDFEYVLSHATMTIAENLEMKRFIVWARSVAEHLVFRHIWGPLRELAGLSQSTVVRDMMGWFERSNHPSAVGITRAAERLRSQPSSIPVFLRYLYGDAEIDDLFAAWWVESLRPQLPEPHVGFLDEVFRYDCLTRPIYDAGAEDRAGHAELEIVDVDGEPYYVRPGIQLGYDVPGALHRIAEGDLEPVVPTPTSVTLYFKVGFNQYYGNHEQGIYFVGLPAEELGLPSGTPQDDRLPRS